MVFSYKREFVEFIGSVEFVGLVELFGFLALRKEQLFLHDALLYQLCDFIAKSNR